MIDIEIRDFQSIEHAKIHIEGFTALVGRSNIGKSAIVRAVKAALTGATGTSFVRHSKACSRRVKGTKTCKCKASVHLVSEGFDLLWEKGDGDNQYVFNGKKLDWDRGFPDFLVPEGLAPVKMGDQQHLLQISDQFFPVFLLDQPRSTVANVLSDVARLDAVNLAAKYAEKDRREAMQMRTVRDKDALALQVRIDGYNGLDPVLTSFQDVEKKLDVLHQQEGTLRRVDAFLDERQTIERDVYALSGVEGVQVPSPSAIIRGQTRLEQTTSLCGQFLDRVAGVRDLRGVDEVKLPAVGSLQSKSSAFQQVHRLHGEYIQGERSVASLGPVETVRVPEALPLEKRCEMMLLVEDWLTRLRGIKEWHTAYSPIGAVAIPDTRDLSAKASKLTALSGLVDRHALYNASMAKLMNEVNQIEEEQRILDEEIQEFGMCPTCARPLHAGDHREKTNGPISVHLPD